MWMTFLGVLVLLGLIASVLLAIETGDELSRF